MTSRILILFDFVIASFDPHFLYLHAMCNQFEYLNVNQAIYKKILLRGQSDPQVTSGPRGPICRL